MKFLMEILDQRGVLRRCQGNQLITGEVPCSGAPNPGLGGTDGELLHKRSIRAANGRAKAAANAKALL